MESNIVNTKIFWQFFSWINQKFCIIYNFSFIHISVPTDSPASIVLGLEGLHPSRGGGRKCRTACEGGGQSLDKPWRGEKEFQTWTYFLGSLKFNVIWSFHGFLGYFIFKSEGGAKNFGCVARGGGKKLKTCLLDLRYFGIIRWIKGTHNKSFAHIRWFTRVIRIYWGCIPLSHK